MDDEMVSYEADIDREYEALTERHKTIKHQLETTLSSYLNGDKVKPVTIQGPYGSGKTQLLYHLFKFTWEKGGVGVYTHLEKIIPNRDMGASDYADYLGALLKKEVDLLKKGESQLMAGKVKEYAIDRARGISSSDSHIVVLIDEVEQQYTTLNGRVRTDDNSPMREVIARVNSGETGFYLVLAFAPVSFYEFSKGEAQTGRFLPIILPIVEPKTFRELFGEVGNFVWWMGKGRYRGVSRTQDVFKANVSNISKISRKELLDVCHNIGSIGGVPSLDFESIEKIDDFNKFRDFLICLGPRKQGGEIYTGKVKIVKKCRIYSSKEHNLNDILEKSLRSLRVSKVTDIGYYLSVILDALCTSDEKMPLFTESDDWRELLNIVEDIILEFEGEDNLPSKDLGELQDNVSEFSYNIRRNAENAAPLEEGYCITPGFLRTLFPFPITSPNLTNTKIEEQREDLGDQTYLGREEHDVSVFFFLNHSKVREYLVQESKSFLKDTKALVAINLGEEKEFDMPKLAKWLHKQRRLSVVTPSRRLSNFLVNFFYWLRNEREESLPVLMVMEKLRENQSIPEKDKARKIAYYRSRLQEYLGNVIPKPPATKYTLGDKTGFSEFSSGRIGFVPEVIGFAFVDAKNDWEAMYKFRKEFEGTAFVSKESANKKLGLTTALENLVGKKMKVISTGVALKRINDSFGKHLPDLMELVEELNKDEFGTIPADEDSQLIFKGIFLYLKEWRDPSKAEEKFREEKSNWDSLLERVKGLSTKIGDFEKGGGKNIFLTHSLEADKTKLENIGKILSECQTKISPYTKFLLSTFIDKTVEVVEPKLNEIGKKFMEFQDSVKYKIGEYGDNFKNIETFDKDTFEWINKSKDGIGKEFQQRFKEACQELTKGGKIDLDNIPDVGLFDESVGEIIDDLETLLKIDENIKQCKKITQEINDKLLKWEDR